jgi:hypothetical protein
MTIIRPYFFVCVWTSAVTGRGDAGAGRNPTKQKKSVRKSTHLHMQAAFPRQCMERGLVIPPS